MKVFRKLYFEENLNLFLELGTANKFIFFHYYSIILFSQNEPLIATFLSTRGVKTILVCDQTGNIDSEKYLYFRVLSYQFSVLKIREISLLTIIQRVIEPFQNIIDKSFETHNKYNVGT